MRYILLLTSFVFTLTHSTARRYFNYERNKESIPTYQESIDYPDYNNYVNKSNKNTYGYDVEGKDQYKDVRDHYTSASTNEYNEEPWDGHGGYAGSSSLFGNHKGQSYGGINGGKGRQGTKALLAVIIPLALLAALGPLLASQVMLPLAVASTTIPVGTLPTGRRKRSIRFYGRGADGRAEFYRHLDLLRSIQRYLVEAGEEALFREDVMVSYLRCSGMLEIKNHCLERLACEFSDSRIMLPPLEQELVSVVLYNIMKSQYINNREKQRLRKAAKYGKYKKGNCGIYYCDKIDNA